MYAFINFVHSSLITYLFSGQKELSIVSPIKGTTRDIVETFLDMNGYVVKISDTAGLRQIPDNQQEQASVEQEGIRRALAR